MPLVSGARVGPYEVVSPLGAGGMGEVYRARDTRLERLVALKILSTSGASPRQIERFHREARAISRVEHPHICTLHDIGQHDGLVFLVMELLEGDSLAARLDQGNVPPERALIIGAEIADALDAAHRRGLIHRDLKPSNVMLTRTGVKLLDFGVAKLREVEVDANAPHRTSTVALTEEGTVVGTLPYMAPEQVEGKEVDGRTDIFALGVVLYEMITGRCPFNGDTRASLAAAILTFDPPVVSSLSTVATPAVDRLTRKCLAKDPDERWQTARDLASELRWLRQDSGPQTVSPSADVVRPTRRRYSMWLAGAALVAIVTALSLSGLFARGPKADPPTAIPRWLPITFRAGTVSSARFAPDGDTVVYSAAWEGRPSALYTTRRGSPESRALDVPNARLSGVSRSGDIAFLQGSQFALSFVNQGPGTLARVSLAGGGSRQVLENVQSADWLLDSSELAVIRAGQVEWPIGTRIYGSRRRLTHLRIAPAGDRLALFEGESVIMLDRSGAKTTLSTGLLESASLAWSPDGSEVWFTGVRNIAEPSLRAVSRSGHERVLTPTPPDLLSIQDVFRDGRLLVARQIRRKSMSCLPPGESQMRELRWLDASSPEALTADGRTVVFGEFYYGSLASGASAPAMAYLRGTDGADAIQLGQGYPEDISPDGRSVLIGIRATQPMKWIIMPIASGEPRTLPPGSFDALGEANFLPDGKRIVFAGREPNHLFRIYVQDTESGSPRPISPEGTGTGGLSTPDGRFVLGYASGQHFLYPFDSSDPQPLASLKASDVPLQWSPDGRVLYVRAFNSWPPVIERVDVATGRRLPWKVVFPADPVGVDTMTRLLITPNGTSYCYDYVRLLSELFIVEGIK